MRLPVIFTLALIPAAAQVPVVHLLSLSRPFSSEFQIGDHFEIQIMSAPRQPISVRTVRQGRTDWGPVIATTDAGGRWSTTGEFEKSDFGGWTEIWTVGGKLATPAIQFDVKAPCLPGGKIVAFESGPNTVLTCEVGTGKDQTFATPSLSDPFRTPDGRFVLGRPNRQTPEQYHTQILNDLITAGDAGAARISLSSSRGGLGDETADLISKLIGVNALTERETKNVLAVIRSAFDKPESIANDARQPSRTLVLLQHLAELTDQNTLKQQITETIQYVEAR
jgi:hypothetical protein